MNHPLRSFCTQSHAPNSTQLTQSCSIYPNEVAVVSFPMIRLAGQIELSMSTSEYAPETCVLRCTSLITNVTLAERIVTSDFVMQQVGC